jgi:hypothetical protein
MHIDGVGWYVRLLCAVDHGTGVTGEPVEEQGSVALDQEDGQPLVEVPDLLRHLFSGMSGQCCTQLLDLHKMILHANIFKSQICIRVFQNAQKLT